MNEFAGKFYRNKLVRFIIGGCVQTAYAFSLNYLLIEQAHLAESFAHAITLSSQTIIGLLINRYFVFEKGKTSLARLSLQYVGLTVIFRGINWLLFTLGVRYTTVPWPIVQGVVLAALLLFKFVVFKKVFEAGRIPPVPLEEAREDGVEH